MKVIFPVQEDKGMDSMVFGHFGSAPMFVMVDTDTDTPVLIQNQEADHVHGQCQPVQAIGGRDVDAIVVGGIGMGALNKLMQAGIITYRAVDGTIADNMALIKAGKLPRFAAQDTCAGHHGGHQCAH